MKTKEKNVTKRIVRCARALRAAALTRACKSSMMAAAALFLSACAAPRSGPPGAVQIWTCRRNPVTQQFTFGGTASHPGGVSMACPVSADGYLLATFHGVKRNAAMIQSPDGGDVFVTGINKSANGYALFPSGETRPWTVSDPSMVRELRLVKAFRGEDLAVLKADVVTPHYFRLRKTPLPQGTAITVASNPLNGQGGPRKFQTVRVEGLPASEWGAWFIHEPQPGDSGSPVLDSHGCLTGLVSRRYKTSFGPVTRAGGISADTLESIIRADRQR